MTFPETLFWVSAAIMLVSDGIFRLASMRGAPKGEKFLPAVEAFIGAAILAKIL